MTYEMIDTTTAMRNKIEKTAVTEKECEKIFRNFKESIEVM